MDTVRWGILATGSIAHSFASDLTITPGAEVVAVGSRSLASAREFADAYDIPHAHASYEALAADPDVDVIYVATPHALHRDNVLTCFEQGKHVLCEKALTLNARDAQLLVDEARRRGLFFMEAMWMRCNPNIRALRDLVAGGGIGEVRYVSADLGFFAQVRPKPRLVEPELGGSALLDVGIYPLTLAWLLMGEPRRVQAAGRLSDQGIDLACSMILEYDVGLATVSGSFEAMLPGNAYVGGTEAWIQVPPRAHRADGFVVHRGETAETVSHPVRGKGYVHEIEEVHRCLRAGLTESALVPLDETVAIMRLMDGIRAQLGVVLPGD